MRGLGRGRDPGSALIGSGRRQVFLEDAGFDWKVLGPDVAEPD